MKYELRSDIGKDHGGIPEAGQAAEIRPKVELSSLLNVLFVTNYTYAQGRYVSPLNADTVDQRAELDKKRKEKEIYTSLVEVNKATERDKGISEVTYETHKYAINSLARDLTGQRWWGSRLKYKCEQQDREGKKASPTQIERFPQDMYYREDKFGHTNIFDEGRDKSKFEGTLFQTDYDQQGNLQTYRIFHQGHRDALKIETVNVSELGIKIRAFVAEYSDESHGKDLGFTLDPIAYLKKIGEFNEQFGNFVAIEVMDQDVVAKFPLNPQQLAERLVGLGQKRGMELKSRKGTSTFTVSSGEPDFYYVDLNLPSHMKGSSEKFDPEIHSNTPTIIMPYLNPKFSIPLIEMYVSEQMK